MSGEDHNDFDDRLAELNNWQLEQQKKLKAFQEAQRKLLDLEHQNILSGFNTHNFGQKQIECIKRTACEKNETESNLNAQNYKSKNSGGLGQLKFPQLRLTEPKNAIFGVQSYSSSVDKKCDSLSESVENSEKGDVNRPKKFLKRGEGLARFRMTLNDFKGPPKIYKERKIKTYLNNKPEPKIGTRCTKSLKTNVKCNRNSAAKVSVKPAPLPVKIYVPENKTKPCNSGRCFDDKPLLHSKEKMKQFYPKTPRENLCLKPHSIATEWYNAMKEKEKTNSVSDNLDGKIESDVENGRDEKELRIFEILEKKVDDSSFCSSSSFVDRLMEQSLSSTPSKYLGKTKDFGMSYIEGLKSLRSQFLDEQHLKQLEELDEIPLENEMYDEYENEKESCTKNEAPPEKLITETTERNYVDNETEANHPPPNESPDAVLPEKESEFQPPKVNKTLLQEYIKDFKKFKSMLADNVHKIEDEPEKEISPKDLLKEERPEQPNQHEIALKLQRKGLQDNIKQLLNWEVPPRKRQPKRVVKKVKPKPKMEKCKQASKEQCEKIVFNSSLLHERLNELEKEIAIFRKENKDLERLQKECNEERIKLTKERKEFQKQIQEEREQLEAKFMEEQKKLQKERTVFEKYCKQVKNQPSRQEREETAKLKKEIEKLTETLTTKEARWGASQARLRNQIKNLEKENAQLKAEVEKYKKMSTKKVSFENERNLNTKIMHVINSELGKLKPTVIKNTSSSSLGRNLPLSARIERDLGEKPIRRIKSAPNVKRQTDVDLCSEAFNDLDEKALGSVSTDSGIETNGSRYTHVHKAETAFQIHDAVVTKDKICEELRNENPCSSPSCGQFMEDSAGKKPTGNLVESVVREAIFEDNEIDPTIKKVAEVKSRLERLNLLATADDKLDHQPVKMVGLHNDDGDSEFEDLSGCSSEDEENESTKKVLETECPLRKGMRNETDSYSNSCFHRSVLETRPGENGIWEKLYEDGSKEINYPNGNVKKIFPGSKIVRMTYYNGDIKETNVAEGSEKYYYAETKTWHTTYKDGLEVLEFPNGQTERRHADGSTEISFPNGCVRYCDASGRDEWRFLDGTVIKTNEHGHKILLMPNGQKEIHTKEFKRREYPDGTVKILYSDGTQETRYASGRVRLKDKDGILVMDSGGIG